MANSDSVNALLSELAHEYTERLRRGETPPLTEYTAQHPDLASQIQDLFPTLRMIEEVRSGGQADYGTALTGNQRGLPSHVGEYRVLREVGRGGMGVVYEAIQESLGRHVALKVLPTQPTARSNQLERFRREARAAAQLHHTNIVPVFAVGEDAGSHYYAMQFIQGQSLDDVLEDVKRLRQVANSPRPGAPPAWPPVGALAEQLWMGRFSGQEDQGDGPADASTNVNRLDRTGSHRGSSTSTHRVRRGHPYFRGVAQIGLQAAEALGYAHEQGVLHRDIKPSNLLLDTHGTLWITDFGLARVAGIPELTVPGDVVGTLRYVPPERFQGRTEARGDIYSLGLTLYEMLSLQPAYDAAERAQLVNQVLHAPLLPPRRFDRHIPRDLETIVLRAVARDPDRRYSTAGELAEDLRRFLTDRPILARRIAPWERTWRWCRRNPLVASLLSLLFVSVLATVGILLHSNLRIAQEATAKDAALVQAQENFATAQQQRLLAEKHLQVADRSFLVARDAIDEYLSRITDDKRLKNDGDLQPLRRELLEAALPLFEQLTAERSENLALETARAKNLFRLALLRLELGSQEAALQSFRQSLAIYLSLAEKHPSDVLPRQGVAECRANVAKCLHDTGRVPEALAELQVALQEMEQLVHDVNESPVIQRELIELRHNRVRMMVTLGRYQDALDESRATVDAFRKLLTIDPTRPDVRDGLSDSLQAFAGLLGEVGDNKGAVNAFQEAVKLSSELVHDVPDKPEFRLHLAVILIGLGNALTSVQEHQESLVALRQAVVVLAKLVDEFPDVPEYADRLAVTQASVGRSYYLMNQSAKALEFYQPSADLFDRICASGSESPEYRCHRGMAHGELAAVLSSLGRHEESEAEYATSLSLLRELTQEFPQVARFASELGRFELNFAMELHGRQRWTEAVTELAQAIDTWERLASLEPTAAKPRARLAQAYRLKADSQFNTQQYAECAAAWRRVAELDENLAITAQREEVAALMMQGDFSSALAGLRRLAEDSRLNAKEALAFARECAAVVTTGDTIPADVREQFVPLVVLFAQVALDRGADSRQAVVQVLRDDAAFRTLRDRAEFQELLMAPEN